jgi:hypothetical protein
MLSVQLLVSDDTELRLPFAICVQLLLLRGYCREKNDAVERSVRRERRAMQVKDVDRAIYTEVYQHALLA